MSETFVIEVSGPYPWDAKRLVGPFTSKVSAMEYAEKTYPSVTWSIRPVAEATGD